MVALVQLLVAKFLRAVLDSCVHVKNVISCFFPLIRIVDKSRLLLLFPLTTLFRMTDPIVKWPRCMYSLPQAYLHAEKKLGYVWSLCTL